MSCPVSGAVSAFPHEMPGLRTCKPLILYSYFLGAGMFVFNYLLFPMIVKTSSSPWYPRAFSPLSVSPLSIENEFSKWISDEFSKWISDFQLVNIFPLWEINTERHWYPRFHGDVVWCWTLREVEEKQRWVYIWMQLQLFRIERKCSYK